MDEKIRPAIKEMDDATLDAMIGYAVINGNPRTDDKEFVQELAQEKALRKKNQCNERS